MLRIFSVQVVLDLNSHSGLIDLLDADGVSALISEQEDGDSFVNYFLKFNSNISKDGAKGLSVVIECWSDTYDKSIALADQVEVAIKLSDNRYEYVSANSEPVLLDSKKVVIVTKQEFNIKK